MRIPYILSLVIILISTNSCKKLEELNHNPETTSLEQGFQTSAAIGYCASLASAVFKGATLPSNVTFESKTQDGYTSAGIIHVNISEDNPIPFNHSSGE